MRVIGICGHDFCGSTLLARLFAAVPSVASGGELRWLITDPGVRGKCSICKGKCPIFDEDLLLGLTPRTLYQRVAERFGKEIIVSSDKGFRHYERFMPPNEVTGIVLFRSPEGCASSDRKHLKVWPYVRRNTIRKSLDEWSAVYRNLLAWAPSYCKNYVVLSYDQLAANPVDTMNRLCERLAIPLDDGGFPDGPLVDRYHNVLGNPSAHNSGYVVPDNSWRRRLSAEERSFIQSDAKTQALHRRLKELAL
jgi:hypothetical protein